ncbi:CDP-glycerol glycerophosphotransferase family protein [Microbacterium kribbense]|uniref:CDP-glycerol glycerophosphotransferase family protein n=1 Tax=Microbacterium kribbense TaxID=433645 RepID=A0ABP7GN27_9MICO
MSARFSVVSPMYNVQEYLPDYFASLEKQSIGMEQLQIILVDDGSTDDTAAVAERFAQKHPGSVTVLRKANGGQASARNLGLEHATGEWVTFPDPDDVLDHNYFRVVGGAAAAASARGTSPAMVSTRLLMWFEESGKIKHSHALDRRFRHGERIVDIDESPDWIQPHATSGFFRMELIREHGLLFPETLRLRFEDSSFVARYLLRAAAPIVQFLPSARYLYRQRSDNSSTIQSSTADPRKYVDTIDIGFRGVIEEALSIVGRVPRWAQNLFLYDQFWILRSSQGAGVRNASFPDDMYPQLWSLVHEYLQQVDEDAILAFHLMPVAHWMREALLLAKRGSGHTTVYRGAVDSERGLTSLVYRYIDERPLEKLTLTDGTAIAARFGKDQGLEYVGRPLIWQRTLWIPDDVAVLLELDSVRIEEFPDGPRVPAAQFRLANASASERPRRAAARRRLKRAARALKRRASTRGLGIIRRDLAIGSRHRARKYADAWAFIDRDNAANDSAEDLYWWVREHHPEVNAWFIVRHDSPDWTRMQRRGARLVDYGTPEFFALLAHAKHLASSHADRFITDALPRKYRSYKFTFLQHGVIKGDISGWLNPKRIDLFVTSTVAEFEYITGPSAYRYGTKEVCLTGMPRFDALQSRSSKVDDADKNLIVVMPTWRDYLVSAMGATSADRAGLAEFIQTDYATQFSALLASLAAQEKQRGSGRRIVFMPHPNMGVYLDRFPTPPEVSVASYDDADVRDILIHAAVLVTDYSSMAFNAAYIDLPVVYFQFDAEAYYRGHTERPGYFSYDDDGFGPVCMTVPDATRAVAAALEGGMPAEYGRRIEETFPTRDGRNCERVYDAMTETATRRSLAERLRSAESEPAEGDRSA